MKGPVKSNASADIAAGAQPLNVRLEDGQTVSALLQVPAGASACYVLAHGAGAGMKHAFLAEVAKGLAERGIATLRYQFLYMEHGSKRPDNPKVAQAAVRAAVQHASQAAPGLPLFAGGKSFGGRMTSQAQSAAPLPGVRGLIFLGFPLHPPGQPSTQRAEHLFNIQIPMLFLQGDRDEFAKLDFLNPLVEQLRPRMTLTLSPGADHSFHVPARSGRKDVDVRGELLDEVTRWIQGVISHSSAPPPKA
ncbi:MAG TPA: alpha/beta family hydrolase [Candidatus Limnocylindrales bacterium]|nr:alpha/beta family hydrolase [Candidatus Limnocylindrales bacterium]